MATDGRDLTLTFLVMKSDGKLGLRKIYGWQTMEK
jgi:hypothetical protein